MWKARVISINVTAWSAPTESTATTPPTHSLTTWAATGAWLTEDSTISGPAGATAARLTSLCGLRIEEPAVNRTCRAALDNILRPGRSGQQRGSGRPDLGIAAQKLGISERQLRDALGPPPPDLSEASRKLGISERELRQALHGQ